MAHSLLTLILITASACLSIQCQAMRSNAGEKGPINQTSSPRGQEAQTETFKEKLFVNTSNEKMRYLLFVPKDYDKQKKYPLVLWLHGGGTRGEDLKLLLEYGNEHGIGYFARADNQSKYPSFIVAPQCPQNRLWGDPESEKPTTEMKLVLEILEQGGPRGS